MCKKKKNIVTPEPNPFENFELKKPEPAYDENGNRDYFTEYYNAYKNNYIDQYLEAYKKLKLEGKYGDISPYIPELTQNTDNVENCENK